jgi:intracellular septation protein A
MFSNIGIDWTQRTTKLGALTLTGAVIALVFICLGDFEKASAVMGLVVTVSGMLGLVVKDPIKDQD